MEARFFPTNESLEFHTEERCYIIEIMNKEGVDFSIARARVEPGVTTALHAVKKTTEAYYILQGNGLVQSANGFEQTVNSGDVMLFPPGIEQKITNRGNDDLIFLAICAPRFVPESYIHLEVSK